MRWMRKSTFEEEIARNGFLLYRNVGDSMLPLIRQGKDLLLIARKPEGRLRKYDVRSTVGTADNMCYTVF